MSPAAQSALIGSRSLSRKNTTSFSNDRVAARTNNHLQDVINRAGDFGYIGLKTKTGPCGGYQAFVAGFKTRGEAEGFADEASRRTGLRVVVIKA